MEERTGMELLLLSDQYLTSPRILHTMPPFSLILAPNFRNVGSFVAIKNPLCANPEDVAHRNLILSPSISLILNRNIRHPSIALRFFHKGHKSQVRI